MPPFLRRGNVSYAPLLTCGRWQIPNCRTSSGLCEVPERRPFCAQRVVVREDKSKPILRAETETVDSAMLAKRGRNLAENAAHGLRSLDFILMAERDAHRLVHCGCWASICRNWSFVNGPTAEINIVHRTIITLDSSTNPTTINFLATDDQRLAELGEGLPNSNHLKTRINRDTRSVISLSYEVIFWNPSRSPLIGVELVLTDSTRSFATRKDELNRNLNRVIPMQGVLLDFGPTIKPQPLIVSQPPDKNASPREDVANSSVKTRLCRSAFLWLIRKSIRRLHNDTLLPLKETRDRSFSNQSHRK
ncbi:unnamed protein product [Caenorhabditis auriculariae]|uniref:Uncharacterized protein n=1 Tax=Caenorhabditis auriculariae TaxID=2777116 RepID=A0A8S1GQ44_9PELO|nr:unnamed protein product [Caenorhabditis auriculariae]